jgi:hypothetical protein
LFAPSAYADPELFVTYEGVSLGGNNQWLVAVAPDPDFFIETTSGFGSSLAVELAFAVEGSTIVDIVENLSDWPADNPGNNPFTNSVTFGTYISPAATQAFTAYGSNVFLSGVPVPLFSMETLGSDLTTVHYGVAASGHPTKGSIIAQAGQNFDVGAASGALNLLATDFAGGAGGGIEIREFTGYTGSVSSVPEPATAVLVAIAAIAPAVLRRRMAGPC